MVEQEFEAGQFSSEVQALSHKNVLCSAGWEALLILLPRRSTQPYDRAPVFPIQSIHMLSQLPPMCEHLGRGVGSTEPINLRHHKVGNEHGIIPAWF